MGTMQMMGDSYEGLSGMMPGFGFWMFLLIALALCWMLASKLETKPKLKKYGFWLRFVSLIVVLVLVLIRLGFNIHWPSGLVRLWDIITHPGSWPWIRMMLTTIILAVFIGPFQKSWKADFFRDQRLPSDRKQPIFVGPYWPAVHSVLGFALCFITMVWSYSWYVYIWPIAIAMLLFFWHFGGTPMTENTQRWIQVFAGRHHLIPEGPDRAKFGLWYFSGGNDTAYPKMSWWRRLFVPPYWFWFTRVDVQSYLSFDEDFDVIGQTSEKQIVHLVGRLIFDRTCHHPSSFGSLPEVEQQASVAGCRELAANRTVDFLALYTQEQLRAGIDERLRKEHPELGTNIADDVLRAKGHCVSLGNFGIPLASPEVVEAQNATVVAKEEAEQKRLKGAADADVIEATGKAQAAADAARELAPAEALAAADSKVRQAYDQITERKRAETIQVNGGAMPTFPVGQEKPKP